MTMGMIMLKPYNSNKLYFFVMRGVPGCGKSTFTTQYMTKVSNVIESDVIREKISGKIIENGRECINQANGTIVWEEIHRQIEQSLASNKSTTIDATNINMWQLKNYEKIAEKYNAELIIIDFSDISLEEAKARNSLRMPEYKRVPDKVIERMYRDLIRQNTNMSTFTALHNHNEILYWLQDVV